MNNLVSSSSVELLIDVAETLKRMEEGLKTLVDYQEDNYKLLKNYLRLSREEKTSLSPKYSFMMDRYNSFDWSAIGAKVEEKDDNGVKVVSYEKRIYLRSHYKNEIGDYIFFSDYLGKDESGKVQYNTLCKFVDINQAVIDVSM